MDNVNFKNVERSIQWELDNRTICESINSLENSPAISFIHGYKISVMKCEEYKKIEKREHIKPGTLCKILDDESFVVKTGDDFIRIIKYRIYLPHSKPKNIKEFLVRLNFRSETILTSIPFITNMEANLWETKYQPAVQDSDSIDENVTSNIFYQTIINSNNEFFSYLIEMIGLKKGSQILDIGCGGGWASYLFSKLGMSVYGCDVDPYILEKCKQKVPDASFFLLDVFNLKKKIELRDKFDLVFCRGLGVAQKIIDWNDEKWISVGKSMIDCLDSTGTMYYTQLTNQSGYITEDGFSNPTLQTLVEYFEKFSHILDISFYGYVCILLTKKNPDPILLQKFGKFIRKRNASIYWKWFKTKNKENSKELVKVLYSQLSNVLLSQLKSKKNGIVIFGTNDLAIAYAEVAKDLGIIVKAFVSENEFNGILYNIQLISIKQIVELDPHAIIYTYKEDKLMKKTALSSNAYHIVEFFEKYDSFSDATKIFLLSGDQDKYVDEVKAPLIIEILNNKKAVRALKEYPIINNSAFDNWTSPNCPDNWSLVGNNNISTKKILSGNIRKAFYLENHSVEAAALFQRLSQIEKIQNHFLGIGCWIFADKPNLARIQLSTDKGDIASKFHSGSGRWEFCSVTNNIENIKYIDVYLQVIGNGEASFRDLKSYLSD